MKDIVDDILCAGKGDTHESAVKDHDWNLIALLARCREKNIKLNPYIGHALTPDGLKPDPSKVKAIHGGRLLGFFLPNTPQNWEF